MLIMVTLYKFERYLMEGTLVSKDQYLPPFRVSNPVLIHFKRPIDTIFPFSLLKV